MRRGLQIPLRPGSHGCKNFASSLQRPLPLQLKILQRGHTHFFIEAAPARCSKFGKLSMACILLFCLSLFSFVSRFFFSLLLSLTHEHGSFSPPPPPPLSLSLSLHTTSCSVRNHTRAPTVPPPSKSQTTFFTDKENKEQQKKSCSANRKRLSAPRMFSFSKEKNNRNCMTSHYFSYCEHCCSHAALFSTVAEEAAPSYLYPQSYCLSSPTK